MTTTINNNERVFAIYGHGKQGPVLCNLADVQQVYSKLIPVTKIKHIWNGGLQRISRKDVAAMLKANSLDSSFL